MDLTSIVGRKNAGKIARTVCLCWTALVVILISTAIEAADRKPSSWDKIPGLKKAGYNELDLADAARFLVGNSVLIPKLDDKYGIKQQAAIYYFITSDTMHECGVGKRDADCFTQRWGIVNNQICLDALAPGSVHEGEANVCHDRTGITIMKSPSTERVGKGGGKIGVYVSFSHYVSDIVKGDRTGGIRFDRHISGKLIELHRTDFEKEIEDASKYSGGDEKVPLSGPRALSLLIGNTFLPDDTRKISIDQAKACPSMGTYYAPDGKVIHFSCHEQMWSISVTHWKDKSGLICRDGPALEDIGDFGFCQPATVTAFFAVPRTENKLLIQDDESGIGLTGYAGNVFNFRFSRSPEAGKFGKN